MRACGHTRHVGTCPECQRAQLARWRTQLIAASGAVRSTVPVASASDGDSAPRRAVSRVDDWAAAALWRRCDWD